MRSRLDVTQLSGDDVIEALVVAKHSRDDHVVAARANRLLLTQLGRADDGLADMQKFSVPPHLLGGPTPPSSRPQALY
jgi:hypothetical protein